jgi:hypothetical protein
MADFEVMLDTSPMAESLDSVTRHVDASAAAVAAMEAAVIENEIISARTICKNVDSGFFSLIRSQISQASIACYTEMSSKLLLLKEHNVKVSSIQKQLERDYQKVKRRYVKLFKSLADALEARIKAFDHYVIHLAKVKKDIVLGRLLAESSLLITSSHENIDFCRKALAALLRKNAKRCIASFNTSIFNSLRLKQSLGRIKADALELASKEIYLPVIYFAASGTIKADETVESVAVGDSNIFDTRRITKLCAGFVCEKVREAEKLDIREYMLSCCEEDQLDDRVKELIFTLFDAADWEVFSKVEGTGNGL